MKDAILGSGRRYGNPNVVLLSGGVGGARMARALTSVLAPGCLTVIVNVGDDDRIYGVHVAADLDTVTYTLADVAGPHGWGVADDTFVVLEQLGRLGADTTFRLGDRDLATCLLRTEALAAGEPLSRVTGRIARALGVDAEIVPASDDPIRTVLLTAEGEQLAFQEYFVRRGQQDTVVGLRFEGAARARAPLGLPTAITTADLVVIAPSNPPLSIWPILAVDDLAAAVAAHERVVAVSPLFGGKPLKGPADRVMHGLGLAAGNAGVLEAYHGFITDLVVDEGDAADVPTLSDRGVGAHAADTRLTGPDRGKAFAGWLLDRFLP